MQEKQKLDKSKLTVEQQAMVEQLEALNSAAESLQKMAEKQTKSDTTVHILDDRSKEIAPVIKTITEAIKAIQEMKHVDLASFAGPIVKAIQALKVDPVVNVPAPKVNVDVPEVDLTGITKEIKALKTDPLTSISDDGGKLYINNKAYEPKHAKIDVTKRGVTSVVEGPIHVVSCFLMASDPSDIQFLSGGVQAMSGFISLLPATGFVLPYNPAGWMQGESLEIEQQGNARIGGLITYIEV